MQKDVIISVKGTQATPYDGLNILELITKGKYYKKGNVYYVTYKESAVTGMEGTTTTLEVLDGVVTLTRYGSVNSHFVFEQGQKHFSYYDTADGAFTVGILTNWVDVNVDDSGGDIKVGYEIEIDNARSGLNNFHMRIREAGKHRVNLS